MKLDFSKYKFHASSVGKIMTESRTKDPLGETCKKHLMECYIWEKYKRKKNIENKYIEKGLAVEEYSITLYANQKKRWFEKNETVFSNEFICGTPDIIEKDAITDIKSSWDIHTFFNVFHQPMNKDYFYQIQSYCTLKDKPTGRLVYCLVDTPEPLINDAKWKLARNMGVIDTTANALYQEACQQLEKEMIFSDIPEGERYTEFSFPYEQPIMDKVYERVEICREFLNKLI